MDAPAPKRFGLRRLPWRRIHMVPQEVPVPEPLHVDQALEALRQECDSLRAENRRLALRAKVDGRALDAKLVEMGDTFMAQQAQIRSKDREIAQLRSILKRTQAALKEATIGDSAVGLAFRLKRSMMHAAGLSAQLELMHEMHPDSPLLEMAGETFEDGRPKTQLRLAYEAAFDSYGEAHHVEAPQSHRRR